MRAFGTLCPERLPTFRDEKVRASPFVGRHPALERLPGPGRAADALAAVEDDVEARTAAKGLAQRRVEVLVPALNDDAEGAHGLRGVSARRRKTASFAADVHTPAHRVLAPPRPRNAARRGTGRYQDVFYFFEKQRRYLQCEVRNTDVPDTFAIGKVRTQYVTGSQEVQRQWIALQADLTAEGWWGPHGRD